MGKTLLGVIAIVCLGCGSDEPPPSCQQAMSAYYGTGCSFVNVQTGQPIPQQQAIADCQTIAGSLSPACEAALDTWLVCLNETSPAENCECSQQQMAVIQCD